MKVLKPTGKILFKEVQQFRQLWLWAILISSALMPIGIIVAVMSQDKKTGLWEKLLVVGIVLGTFAINAIIFYIIRLETVVTEEGLFYRWWPFVKKYRMFRWQEIATITVRKYPYFKYGYHITREYGKVHNTNGNKGIQFVLQNGKKVYIGTQKLNVLQYTLEQIRPVTVESK
ncbi:MAG: hypothetical protein J7621_12455 [Niastella sp.]|nr:hypothetical protein [Niastella sp.]